MVKLNGLSDPNSVTQSPISLCSRYTCDFTAAVDDSGRGSGSEEEKRGNGHKIKDVNGLEKVGEWTMAELQGDPEPDFATSSPNSNRVNAPYIQDDEQQAQ